MAILSIQHQPHFAQPSVRHTPSSHSRRPFDQHGFSRFPEPQVYLSSFHAAGSPRPTGLDCDCNGTLCSATVHEESTTYKSQHNCSRHGALMSLLHQ